MTSSQSSRKLIVSPSNSDMEEAADLFFPNVKNRQSSNLVKGLRASIAGGPGATEPKPS